MALLNLKQLSRAQWNVVAAITGIAITLFLMVLRGCNGCNKPTPTAPTSNVVVIHDTVITPVAAIDVRYKKIAKIIRDTVFVDNKASTTTTAKETFVAVNDTTIDKVRISDTFYFPERMFSTSITRPPDSVRTINSVFVVRDTVFQVQIDRKPLWQDILQNVGAAVLGFFVGRSTK